jgi:predicted nucleic acid-binding protein
MFIHCALAGNATVVISGDAHLLTLKSYLTVKIITPAQALSSLV